MDALKRQTPLTFVPTFLIEKLTAGRLPEGTVELATNESAELVARYPTFLMITIKSGRPVRVGIEVPAIRYVLDAVGPGVGVAGFAVVTIGFGVVEVAVVVVATSGKGIVVDATEFGITEREESGAGLKTEPRYTAAEPTMPGTNRVEYRASEKKAPMSAIKPTIASATVVREVLISVLFIVIYIA